MKQNTEIDVIKEILNLAAPQVTILAMIYVLVIVLVFLDLWAGVTKAKERGEYRSSVGFRRTVEKVGKYFNMLFAITVIDTVQMIAVLQLKTQGVSIPLIPILTLLGGVFVGFIELKSIYEKNEDKERARISEAAKLAGEILKNQGLKDVLMSLGQYIDPKGAKTESGPEGEYFDIGDHGQS